MGMFDELKCKMPMPDGRNVQDVLFQTKSLWCSMDLFTITETGRLIFHKRRYCFSEESYPGTPKHIADIDMDYHGDIEIHGVTMDRVFFSYAVRFVHGTVEWIRPFEELSEIHQEWIRNRRW